MYISVDHFQTLLYHKPLSPKFLALDWDFKAVVVNKIYTGTPFFQFACLFTWSTDVTSKIDKAFMRGNCAECTWVWAVSQNVSLLNNSVSDFNCTQEFMANAFQWMPAKWILLIQKCLPNKIWMKQIFSDVVHKTHTRNYDAETTYTLFFY